MANSKKNEKKWTKAQVESLAVAVGILMIAVILYLQYRETPKELDSIIKYEKDQTLLNIPIDTSVFATLEQDLQKSVKVEYGDTNNMIMMNPFILPEWIRPTRKVSNLVTNPNTGNQISSSIYHEESKPKKIKLNDFQLTSTFIDGKQRFATINGKLYTIGKEIKGYILISIESRQILLTKNNSTLIIKMPNE